MNSTQQQPMHQFVVDHELDEKAIIANIDSSINSEVHKHMELIINQAMQSAGIVHKQEQMSGDNQCSYDLLMTVIDHFVCMCDHYEQSMVSKEDQHQRVIVRMEQQHKLQKQEYLLQSNYAAQEMKGQLKLLMNKNLLQTTHITEITSQLEARSSGLLNSNRKLSMLQAKLEAYEYQLQQKNVEIMNMHNQITEVMQLIAQDIRIKQKSAGVILANLQADFDQIILKQGQLAPLYSKQQQLIITVAQLFQMHIQPHLQQTSELQPLLSQLMQIDVAQSPIRLLANIQEQEPADAIRKSVRNSFEVLLQKYKGLTQKNNSLAHRYSLFLHETEQTMQDCKIRIKGLEQDKIKLTACKECSGKIIEQQAEQINLLKGTISTKVNQEIHKQQQHTQQLNNLTQSYGNQIISIRQDYSHQIQKLKQQLESKSQKVEELEMKLAAEEKLYREHAMQLTIEVESLKETILSLQNTIELPVTQQNTPFHEQTKQQGHESKQMDNTGVDGIVLQQIIDKTYEIRLENYKLKCSNQEMQNTISSLQSALQLTREQVEQLNNQVNGLKQRQQIDNQLRERLQHECQSICEQKQQLLIEINNKNSELLSKLSTIDQYQTEKQALTARLEQIQLQRQLLESRCSPSYEQIAMLKVQVYVLNEIITLMKGAKETNNIGVQAQIYQPDEEELMETKRQQDGKGRKMTRGRSESIGCLVSTKKDNIPQSFCKVNEEPLEDISNLSKTCKIRQPPIPTQASGPSSQQQVQQLNDLINYMICYLKGYTRNGIRKSSWLSQQGDDYLIRIQSSKNIKQKYGLFERVRSLTARNQTCAQLVSDYQKITSFYFSLLLNEQLHTDNSLGMEVRAWENSNNKENMETTYTKSKFMDSMLYSTSK